MTPCVSHLGTVAPELLDLAGVGTCHVHCQKLTVLQAHSELVTETLSGTVANARFPKFSFWIEVSNYMIGHFFEVTDSHH